ncbi:hypothetical protein NL676_033190 [Syzygium grande]|nr:hypothetical protein NL676_033190 [Syzygium grande]
MGSQGKTHNGGVHDEKQPQLRGNKAGPETRLGGELGVKFAGGEDTRTLLNARAGGRGEEFCKMDIVRYYRYFSWISDEIPGFLLKHSIEKYGEMGGFLLGYSDETPGFSSGIRVEKYCEISGFLLGYSDETPGFLLRLSDEKYDEISGFLLGYSNETPGFLLE